LDQTDLETIDDVPEAKTKDSEDDSGVGKEAEVGTSSVAIGLPQAATIVQSMSTGSDIGGQPPVDSPARSPALSDQTRIASYHDAPDAPSFELFPVGSLEWLHFNKVSAAIPDLDLSCVNKIVAAG
jgi:hypothetical protein